MGKITRGIVLAGGLGTRLLPLTRIQNKHLLNIYNKQMIMYPIDVLLKAGIKDITIVTGPEWAGDFIKLLESGEKYGCRFFYTFQDRPGGIAEALLCTENHVGKDNMVVLLGDNIINEEININDFNGGARVYLKEVRDPERFGVAKFNKDKIVEIIEKPKIPPTNFAVSGLYMYDNSVFDIIRKLKPSDRGELEITDVNNKYLEEDKLEYRFLHGYWLDAGSIESLYEASTFIRNLDKK